MTSAELFALHESVVEMAKVLRARAERVGSKEAWEAWVCLNASLYDLWGAFGSLALDEQRESAREGTSSV